MKSGLKVKIHEVFFIYLIYMGKIVLIHKFISKAIAKFQQLFLYSEKDI